MASRVGLAAMLVFVFATGVTTAAARQPPTATAMYVVRNDQRLCPSPRCGGYWVAIANGARTRCQDGLRRVRCYAARAVDRKGAPVSGIVEEALVRGALDAEKDDLGLLVVSAIYAPAGDAAVSGGFYRVRDTGIRCVRAPCFAFRAQSVNASARVTTSSVDLEASGATQAEIGRAQVALPTKDGLYARGRFAPTPDGGRVFRALRLYLRAPLPRA
jgi:hypothetical protein